MSRYTVYIKAPDYLADWLRHDFFDPESGRVSFPRGSAPRAVLVSCLRRPPRGFTGYIPQPGDIPVEIPSVKGVNPASFCYLSEPGKTALVSACKRLFQAVVFNELSMLFPHDVMITDIIYDFLDRHGIDPSPKNWESVRQIYARLRKKSLVRG